MMPAPYITPKFIVPKNKVALSPFPTTSIEKENKGGFVVVKQKVSLTALRVVFGTTSDVISVPTGSIAYVRGDSVTLPWAKEVFEVAGHQFILAPIDAVQLVET